MLINVTNGVSSVGVSTPTTYGVDISGLPPLLQVGVMVAFAIAGVLMAWFGHRKGIAAGEQQAIKDQRSALEKYFDNPETLAAVKISLAETQAAREEVRAMREVMFNIAGGVRDALTAEVHTNRTQLKQDIHGLRELVESEASKVRDLMRRQEEGQVTSRRITEGNIMASVRDGQRETRDGLRDNLKEIADAINHLEAAVARLEARPRR